MKYFHVVTDFSFSHPRINLSCSNFLIPQHFTYGFNRYIILQRDCRSKGMPGSMSSQMLIYITNVCQFLQIRIVTLVAIINSPHPRVCGAGRKRWAPVCRI
jgi:hypothetical protein